MNGSSYYECKRCFYTCKQKNDMIKHLNIKKICKKSINSYKYSEKDEELYNLSLIKNNNNYNNIECTYCNKNYSTKSNLLQHINKYCKKKDVNNIKDKPFIDKSIIGNNNNIDNSITNINFNFNIIKSFDDNWSIDHLDNKDKLVLLLNNSKFTSTLENILENEVNLNVLIENNNCLVYKNNKLDKMNIKDIVKNTMEKLYKQLNNFKDDIINPNNLNINESIINNELNIAKNKYNDYKSNKCIQDNVNKYITDIYQKKVENTYKKYRDIAKYKEGF